MKKLVVGLYNKKVQFYENDGLVMFPSELEAKAVLSRGVQDAYERGEVTVGWLQEHDYRELGWFDTVFGQFDQSMITDEQYVPFAIDCYQECKRLVKQDES